MADKSFGVKELNLLNASGTPTVTSPNNLNLNANTVAISTSCTIGSNLTVTSTTNSANLNVTGIGTLTRGFATDLSVSGISTISQPSNANPHSLWDVVNNGSSAYRFTGPGQDGAEDNPNIYLVRGQRYIFKVNASGHPFQLRVANGGAAYSDGVTNNGAQSGNVVINVQHDAPAQLYYQCTSHGGMVGNIYIVGGPQVISGVVTATTFSGSGASLTNLPSAQLTGALPALDGSNLTGLSGVSLSGSTNNTIVTVTGANAITGESTLTYNGSDTFELQPASATPAIFIGDSNRTGAGQGLAQFRGNWNGTTVARITFDTGDDTTNKDDGIIRFDTSSTGSLVERVRINRSGYLGIGNVTSPDDKVEIRTGANDQGVLIKSTGSTSNAIKFDANRSGTSQGLGSIKARWNGTTVAQMYMNTGDDTSDKNDGYIAFGTEHSASNGNANATERMRLDKNGDLGLGIAPVPQDAGARTLHIHDSDSGSAARAAIRLTHGSSGSSASNGAFIGFDNNPDFYLYNQEDGNIRFGTNGSERMRIHSNGALSVGTSPGSTYWGAGTAAFFESTVQNTVTISHSGSGNNYPLTVRNNRVNSSTGGYMLIFFGASAVLQGSIISNNGSTSYNSGSDYRLKENIVDISDGITRVKQLQPRRFNWISDSNKTVQDGFIAHELQSVVPESTTGTKDEIVNQEGINDGSYHPDAKVGDAVYQSVDYGKVTPLLTAALKEAIAKIETLEAKVAALEGS